MANEQFKSPFYIIQEFISPLVCENIIDDLDWLNPDLDTDGRPIKMMKFDNDIEEMLYKRLSHHIEDIEKYYSFKHEGIERINFEWYTEGTKSDPSCENSEFLRGKWVKVRKRDISGVLFFCEYSDKTPFDQEYEVYGGKLEFPQHHFGFNPQRGTLILYPSGPHFINSIAAVAAGDLFQAKFHIASTEPLLYNPRQFPGDYTVWFKNFN